MTAGPLEIGAYQTHAVQMLPVVGESHADAMLGACVRDASGAVVACSPVAHVPGFRTNRFLDEEGRIHPSVVIALESLRILGHVDASDPRAMPQHVAAENVCSPEWARSWCVMSAFAETPVLFVVGEINARFLYKEIPPHADVPVRFASEALRRIPTFAPTAVVNPDAVDRVISNQLAPMFSAFELLRGAGLKRIALHSISPCTADDAQYLHEIRYDTRALTRYKIIMLFNEAMRSFCRSAGFLFVDRWDDFTDGGLVRDGYMADAVHIAPAHMRDSLIPLYQTVQPPSTTRL